MMLAITAAQVKKFTSTIKNLTNIDIKASFTVRMGISGASSSVTPIL